MELEQLLHQFLMPCLILLIHKMQVLVAFTGVISRHVGTVAGVILILLGLFPKLGGIIAAMPDSVIGGAAIIMFGLIARSRNQINFKIGNEPKKYFNIVFISFFWNWIICISGVCRSCTRSWN